MDRRFVKPHPAELVTTYADNLPDLPPWMKCETLAGLLREQAPGLRVVHAEGSAYCYVTNAEADLAPEALPPAAEEYADCWRGVVLCGADWAAAHPDEAAPGRGPHECLAGGFYLFGDMELMERVKPAAESIHFGPQQGTRP